MFAAAQKAARKACSASLNEDTTLQLPLQCLPGKYSFSQLSDEVLATSYESSKGSALERLLLLFGSLSNPERVQREDSDDESINKLSLWTARLMLPDASLILKDELPEDSSSAQRERAVRVARDKGTLGTSTLSALLQLLSHGSDQLDPEILVSVAAFTSARDPWTTPNAQEIAQDLLSHYSVQTHSKDFIIDYVLQSFIRPLFSKSNPDTITATGRKAMPTSAPPKKHDVAALDHASKPWKYEAPYSVTVFYWAVKNASQEIISAHWNMFIPPILTLLDTPTTSILVRGLSILPTFLPKFVPKLLQQTGLGEVFEDAVMPTLLYLPTITPLEESLQILPAAFEALFILADIRFPLPTSSTSTPSSTSLSLATSSSKTASSKPNTEEQRLAFLDRVLRKGILVAHFHASEQPQITTILLSSISTLVSKMGIHSLKHLKDILPILTEVTTDPFAAARPEGLIAAVIALRSVVLNAWPRMGLRGGGRGMEVLRCLVGGWKIVNEAEEDDDEDKKKVLGEVKEEIKVVGQLLVKAIEAVDTGVVFKEELKPLLSVDPRLGDIFGVDVEDGDIKY